MNVGQPGGGACAVGAAGATGAAGANAGVGVDEDGGGGEDEESSSSSSSSSVATPTAAPPTADLEEFRLQWQDEVRRRRKESRSAAAVGHAHPVEEDRHAHLRRSAQDQLEEERQSTFQKVRGGEEGRKKLQLLYPTGLS